MKPGPHWEYFYKDGSSYLNDKSHKAAWCKACFDLRLNSIVRAEQEAQLVNPTLTMRAEESMRKQGEYSKRNLPSVGSQTRSI